MNESFWYRFISSRVAVGGSVAGVLILVAAALFRIIPWWLFFAILIVAALGVAGYWVVSEWLALRRDKSFERGVSAQAETQMARRRARDRDAITDMHGQWKEGLGRLRQSRMGKGRRALYFLPWYLIIGKPATGKTTAIKNAGLHFPLGSPKTKGTGGTRNCDWFFTEEAILLDTAGRYADSEENTADRDEWIAFLRLLRKYRRDMPINGLLVAVAADDLLSKDRDDITDDARTMRKKLDELMAELGVQFPVYLLITKCDLVQGFTEFFGRLPKARLTELLGWTNPSWETDDLAQVLTAAFVGLRDRCKSFRPVFLREEDDPVRLRNVYLFPEELEALTKCLAQYCDLLFRETRYSDSPFLRGIYLTSGMQTGTAISRMLEKLKLPPQAARLAEGSRSFFLQDFFQERLKADQRLVAPTGRASLRFRMANNVSLAAVIGVCVLIGLFATASYVRNRTLLLSIEDSVAATATVDQRSPAEQFALLDTYRRAVETLRYRNRHRSWLERFGLYSGEAAERPVVNHFLQLYGRLGYRPALTNASAALGEPQDTRRAFSALETLIGHLAVSHDARFGEVGSGGEALAPWWNTVAADDAEVREQFAAAYRFYVREPWRQEGDPRTRELAERERSEQVARIKERLPDLLRVGQLTRWLEGGTPIRASDFDLPPGAAGNAMVHAAFTPTAWRQVVVPMLGALETVARDLDGEITTRFAREYAGGYYGAWRDLVLGLREATGGGGRRYCEEDSPYMTVLEAVHEATTRPFALRGDGATAVENKDEKAAADRLPDSVPGFEPPPWVRALGRVVREKRQYIEKMGPACNAARGAADPCSVSLRLGRRDVVEGGPSLAQLRSWVRSDLVGVGAGADSDDSRVRDHVARLLMVPVTGAERLATTGCQDFMQRELVQAMAGVPTRPPWTLDQIETIFAPGGRVDAYCQQTLTPFFSCASMTAKPNAPVRVPASVVSFMGSANKLRRAFFYPNGGWRAHTITFESIPSTSEGAAQVTQTVLSVFCSHVAEQPWALLHRQTRVKKALGWQPDQCGEAHIRVSLGLPGGGMPRTVEMTRSGPFGLLDLLAQASRSGNEFRWRFPGEGVTAAFRVRLPETYLLDYRKMSLPR